MNSRSLHMDDDGPMRPVEKKKKKRVKTEKFSVRDVIHPLFKGLDKQFEDSFEDFVLDEWRFTQRRRIRGSGINRLEEWLKKGIEDTLYARRILRKGRV